MFINNRGDKIESEENISRLEYRLKGDYINGLTLRELKLTPIGYSTKVKPLITGYT